MVERKRAALARACDVLTAAVDDARAHGRVRLPPVATLAEIAGVSHVTMLKATGRLVDEGRLRSWPGRGLTLPTGRVESRRASHSASRAKWERTADRLASEIREATFQPGQSLPLPKELASRLGVSPPTLRKALKALAARGLLAPDRRSYRAADLQHDSRSSTVVLVTRGDRLGVPAMTTPRTRANLDELERECMRHGLTLDVVLCDFERGDLYSLDSRSCILHDRRRLRTALGVLVWSVSIQPAHLLAIRDRVVAAEIPVAVLDENGAAGRDRLWPRGRRVRAFRPALGAGAGSEVARHLAVRCHRQVAFVSHAHDAEWSRERLRGVREVLGAMSVTAISTEGPAHADAGDTQPAAERVIAALRREAPGSDALLLDRTSEAIRWQVNGFLARSGETRLLNPLFQKAVRLPNVTAWVCANDAVALAALSFLERRRVRVPADLSVIGFDNSEEGRYRRLTTYDFNAPGVTQAMLAHVLGSPLVPKRLRGAEPVEIPGFLVVRGTLGRARGALRHA